MKIHIRMSRRASRDIESINPGPDRHRLVRGTIEKLTTFVTDGAGDVTAIAGARPWLRLRVGDYRVLFRRLTENEVEMLNDTRDQRTDAGVLVERVIHRSDLSRALKDMLS